MKNIIPFFISFSLSIIPTALAQNANYQIGDSWSREQVNLPKGIVGRFGSQYSSLVKLIGKFNGGTATYIGKRKGKHLVITNHHVCSKPVFCIGQYIRFTNTISPIEEYGGIWGKSQKLLLTIPEFELSLIQVSFSEKEEEDLMIDLAKNIKFQESFEFEQELLVFGYGSYKNPSRGLSIAYDKDCQVFSPTDYFKIMKDPDQVNPVPYQVWSVAIGCDTSHGDSGSPVVDRRTGQIVGIVWTGKVPKNSMTRKSSVLTKWKKNNSPLIWQELTYMVPIKKIKTAIDSFLTN